MTACVLTVNVGRPRLVALDGRTIKTAIWKAPVDGPVAVRGVNVAGDDQADRSVHGGPDKALYSYAREDQEWWERELGRSIDFGGFGENLTLRGVDASGAVVGERWRVGTAVLQVSEPRIPCFKLGLRMGDARFVKRFGQASRPGAYLRIVEEGEIAPGDPITVLERPDHGITMSLISDAYLKDHALAKKILEAPQLSSLWRDWALSQA